MTNVFGERFWIEAADRGADAAWQRWSMFTINVREEQTLPPIPACCCCRRFRKIQESAPTEDILLVRDEVANMVWGVETDDPLTERREPSAGTRGGAADARLLREAARARIAGGVPPACRHRPRRPSATR